MSWADCKPKPYDWDEHVKWLFYKEHPELRRINETQLAKGLEEAKTSPGKSHLRKTLPEMRHKIYRFLSYHNLGALGEAGELVLEDGLKWTSKGWEVGLMEPARCKKCKEMYDKPIYKNTTKCLTHRYKN